MKKIIIFFLIGIMLCGCSNTKKDNIKTLMSENEYIILDVRTKEEYDEGHLVDSINIPYDEIHEDTDLDKEKNIFVYCRSGNRSGIAAKTLKELGYNVYDLGSFDSIDLPKE